MSQAGPKRIGDLVARVIARYGAAQTTVRQDLERGWKAAAGEQVARHTRVGAIRRGVLEVLVDNASLLGELEGFRKQQLLERLGGELAQAKVTGLRFRRM